MEVNRENLCKTRWGRAYAAGWDEAMKFRDKMILGEVWDFFPWAECVIRHKRQTLHDIVVVHSRVPSQWVEGVGYVFDGRMEGEMEHEITDFVHIFGLDLSSTDIVFKNGGDGYEHLISQRS